MVSIFDHPVSGILHQMTHLVNFIDYSPSPFRTSTFAGHLELMVAIPPAQTIFGLHAFSGTGCYLRS
ncbi:hypothetical protein Y1Q_0005903 [Alligator mississippiensis]|uniref:Uncharacterized protein n=1 Tax=Alligator mississippiensis TaxID=8496 RepID=A0A151MUN9_ALLMI|nr:hypothetical protein Y1Q_0005903 [Alligator mississippiensis]